MSIRSPSPAEKALFLGGDIKDPLQQQIQRLARLVAEQDFGQFNIVSVKVPGSSPSLVARTAAQSFDAGSTLCWDVHGRL